MYFLPIIIWIPIIFIIVNIWSKSNNSIKRNRLLLAVMSFIFTFLLTYGIYVFTGIGKGIDDLSSLLNVFWLLYLIVIAPALFTIILCYFVKPGEVRKPKP